MKSHNPASLTLDLAARPSYLHVATHFAESSASAFGLGRNECLKLGLAVEEIFMHLCNAVCPEQPLEISAIDGIYYTRVEFRFSATRLDMRGLNIATSVSCGTSPDNVEDNDESDLEAMGLMLASRSVDYLNIDVRKGGRILLSVTKEKAYPELPASGGHESRGETGRKGIGRGVILRTPDPEYLKILATEVSSGGHPFVPHFFYYPGKVVDMVESGEYQAVTAVDDRKSLMGGALFRFVSEKIVEIYGPYVVGGGDDTVAARMILDSCLGRVARTKALGLVSLWGLPSGVRENFEPLGVLHSFTGKGPRAERPAFYRHLHEDPGSEAWVHADLAAWLRNEYDRLILARDVRIVQPMGEDRSGSSLFAADLDRKNFEAVLRPVWPGDDLDANIERHVSFLRSEGFLNILLELDLGVSWHSELMPALASKGFQPRLIIPFAGKSDVIVFQYAATES